MPTTLHRPSAAPQPPPGAADSSTCSRATPRGKLAHDIVMELLQIIEGDFHASYSLLRIGREGFPINPLRIDHALMPPQPTAQWPGIGCHKCPLHDHVSPAAENPKAYCLLHLRADHFREEGHGKEKSLPHRHAGKDCRKDLRGSVL